MKKLMTIFVAALTAVSAFAAPKTYDLTSPGGKIKVTVESGEGLTYTLTHGGDLLVDKSEINMLLKDGTIYGGVQKAPKVTRRSVNQTLPAITYKKSQVVDNFNEMTLKYKEYSVVFRAYDEGMAYRFVSHAKAPFFVESECAEFNFAEDWNMWIPYVTQNTETLESQHMNSFENQYVYHKISEYDKDFLSFVPLMVDGPKGKKIVITEADLMNYPGMFLYNNEGGSKLAGHYAPVPKKLQQGGHNELQMIVTETEDYIAKCDGACTFPWRVVTISENDAQMADNDMVWKLATPADPSTDWSWVKPGKVAWDWWNGWNLYGVDFRAGINNDTYKYYIDFASKNGIEYVIMDEGWAVNLKADLFQVIPEIDLQMLVDYAAERNVGIILWAGYWAFDRDIEKACKYFSEMGVKGFKVDFMDRDDQVMVDFHRRAAEMCAKYHMMVDFHGTYKPTGLHRTYPNVVNYEGVNGLEQMKWSSIDDFDQVTYDVQIPFIRMVAGPFDYTQGAMRNATYDNHRAVDSEAMSQGTRCRQLAEFMVFDAPFSMLCDSPSNYMAEPECTEFIAGIPTVWDETKPLDGKVGEYVVMARRSGDEWYVGALTNWDERDLAIDLSFLPAGNYTIEYYKDGINADRAARDYKKVVEDFTPGKINVHMAPGGGYAAKITKK
ncbi:MAG: glycoside hydrolase family 97 protein [Bacteroidales bacterium]|nr:glycoside hydrolase family 97 protein [Bacteroidales bacterium]